MSLQYEPSSEPLHICANPKPQTPTRNPKPEKGEPPTLMDSPARAKIRMASRWADTNRQSCPSTIYLSIYTSMDTGSMDILPIEVDGRASRWARNVDGHATSRWVSSCPSARVHLASQTTETVQPLCTTCPFRNRNLYGICTGFPNRDLYGKINNYFRNWDLYGRNGLTMVLFAYAAPPRPNGEALWGSLRGGGGLSPPFNPAPETRNPGCSPV